MANTQANTQEPLIRVMVRFCDVTSSLMPKGVEQQYEELERNLLAKIDDKQDNLHLYRLTEPVELRIKEHGHFRAVDFEGPLAR